jgi:2-phosphoglycerate kinase
LTEKDKPDQTVILGLVEQTVLYCLVNGYDVILEGIFPADKYRDMLVHMIGSVVQNEHQIFTFYLDVSLEETLRRHKTKREACEFGEDKLRQWYRKKDYLNIREEVIIPETLSPEESIERIMELVK